MKRRSPRINPKTTDKPGVAEVRRWRVKLWEQGGRSLKGVMKLLRENAANRTGSPTKSARTRRRAA